MSWPPLDDASGMGWLPMLIALLGYCPSQAEEPEIEIGHVEMGGDDYGMDVGDMGIEQVPEAGEEGEGAADGAHEMTEEDVFDFTLSQAQNKEVRSLQTALHELEA